MPTRSITSPSQGRVRPLVRLGYQADILEVIIVALVGKALLSPGQLHYFKVFPEPLSAFRVGDVVPVIGPGKTAAANAQVKSAPADVVQSGYFLGHAHR